MLVSELVRRTSVPLATIKFYLREGVLHPGRRTNPRSAEYDESHVRRLRLLRLLREVGGIPVDRLRAVVEAAEDHHVSVHEMFARAVDALAPPPPPPGHRRPEAEALADRVLAATGWTEVRAGSANRRGLVAGIEALAERGDVDERALAFYARFADQIGRAEIAALARDKDRTELLEDMVVGSVVYGQLLEAMRRLAEEHYSAQTFGERY